MTFEFRLDARDLRNPLDGRTFSHPTTHITSSTPRQWRRRGWAAGGMIRVLICGSLTPLRASLRWAVTECSTHRISRVCRFGRDSRHLTSGSEGDQPTPKYTVMNLQRARISPDPGEGWRQKYLTVVARSISAHNTFVRVVSFLAKLNPPGLHAGGGNSRRSQTHGSNLNRIALHVMLSSCKNRTRCR